ncbi:(deoxy)nucleoside triphosphate pyrophosphohydrolase [Desulfonatronovibrio hydrogenovorans]|uniref:(deoxy)nucleoside triphosphate pyrophosphohydrolase n=1 Tax=Desulfonatronovibrio hydrogenovorans TaxID=53245 RepID=UPI00048B26AD|nr:(deoxy)nucleoside triphosphate pyrophosphohydrolase [Desulfonatronovibrio hydrogenovorans]
MSWISVAAGIVVRDGLVLGVQRPQGKVLAGFWEFPGGKAEPGEPVAEALVRELYEELGIIPRDFWLWTSLKKSYDHINAHVHFYMVTGYDGNIVARERQEMAWFDPAEAVTRDFLPADQEILERLALKHEPPFLDPKID